EFYLWVSLGGVIGGMFNALLAPVIFSAIYEYPLMLALACLLRWPDKGSRIFRFSDLIWPLGTAAILSIGVGMGIGVNFAEDHRAFASQTMFVIICVAGALALLSAQRRPLALCLTLAALLFIPGFLDLRTEILAQERSFFGVLRVRLEDEGRFVVLLHGVIAHGAAFTDPTRWTIPLTYYHPDGPAGQFFRAMPPDQLHKVGV